MSDPRPPQARRVPTPAGPARVTRFAPQGPGPRARVVLGHGAGRGADTADLLTVATRLPADGVEVLLVDQPWVLAGRRVAPGPPALDQAWRAVVEALPRDGLPVVWGGRSAGARVAARGACWPSRPAPGAGAREAGAPGALLLLAFPLHPPGRPGASRADELAGAVAHGVPAVVVQGARDPFGGPDELRDAAPGLHVVGVAGSGHDLLPSRSGPLTAGEVGDLLVLAALRAVHLARRECARPG